MRSAHVFIFLVLANGLLGIGCIGHEPLQIDLCEEQYYRTPGDHQRECQRSRSQIFSERINVPSQPPGDQEYCTWICRCKTHVGEPTSMPSMTRETQVIRNGAMFMACFDGIRAGVYSAHRGLSINAETIFSRDSLRSCLNTCGL